MWILVATHLFQLAPRVHFLFNTSFCTIFIIVSSTLMGLYESSHILQVDMGGLSPNPTGLFCMFSCQHILLYF
jgi:hypothetical protein